MTKLVTRVQPTEPTTDLAPMDPLPKLMRRATNTAVTPGAISNPTINARLQTGALPFESNVENYLATNQSKWELLGKAGLGIITEAVAGTIEGGSYLLDFEQMIDKLKGSEEEYTNWLADSMKKAKEAVGEGAGKVYQTEDAQSGFAPSDATWWAKHTPQTIGTALSLMIPAAGVAGITGKAASILNASTKSTKLAKGIAATVASRYAESTMEANQVYEQAYNELLSRGVAENEARSRAGEAASKTWNTNWVFALQDFMQYNTMLKGFGSLSKGKLGKSILEFGKQTVSEAAEEAGQFITSEEAMRTALNEDADYFGEGFNKRLSEYVQNPEFQASALLGAVGGGVFTAAGKLGEKTATSGEELANKLNEIFKQNKDYAIQKEVANYTGDTAKSAFLDNKAFQAQVDFHRGRGTLNVLKANYEMLEKEEGIDNDARTFIRNKVEDIEFMQKEEGILKSSDVPTALHNKIIDTKVEQRSLAKLDTELTREVNDIEQDIVKNKELDNSLVAVKRAQMNAYAYTKLAEKQPAFKVKAEQALAAFVELASTIPNVEQALTTSRDLELKKKALQLVATQEKMTSIKTDLAKLNSPEGIKEMAKREANKAADVKASAVLNKPDATKEEILAAANAAGTPGVAAALLQKHKEIKETEKQANKEKVAAVLDKPVGKRPTPDELNTQTPDQFEPELPAAPQPPGPEMLESIPEPEGEFVFDEEENIEEKLKGFAGGTTSTQAESWFGADLAKKMTARAVVELKGDNKPQHNSQRKQDVVSNEKAKTQNTVVGWLNQTQVEWINNEAVPVMDLQTGRPVIPVWYDRDGKSYPVQEVFEATNGLLYKDSPLLKVGDPVMIVLDNEFPYTFQNGFKPSPGQEIINVYRILPSGRLAEKPLFQIPNVGKKGYTGNPQIHAELVAKVIKQGRVQATIASKSFGRIRKAPNGQLNTLEILEFDYVEDTYKKVGHPPVLGFVDFNGNVQVPNLGSMNISEEELDQISELVTTTSENKGSILTFRMSPTGHRNIVMLHPRQLNDVEKAWVKSNLGKQLKEGNPDLDDMLFIPRTGYQAVNAKKSRLGQFDRKRLHIIERSSDGTNEELLIPTTTELTPGLPQQLFISLQMKGQTSQVENFMEGKPFTFRYYQMDGKVSQYLNSTDPEVAPYIGILSTQMEEMINNQYRNVNNRNLNSDDPYVDVATGATHKNYYEFVVATKAIMTDLPGSLDSQAKGLDSSYSYYNSGVHIAPEVENKPKVEIVNDEITIEHDVPEPEEKKGPTEQLTEEELLKQFGYNRVATPAEGFKVMTPAEIEWFTERYGKEALQLAEGVDRILGAGGLEAFGYYHNALVRLAQLAETGTAYHEAFHFVFDPKLGLISSKMRKSVLDEAAKIYGNKTEAALEEQLAEDFRLYMLSGGKAKPVVTKAKSFFAKIMQAIKNLLGMKSPIERLFKDINNTRLTDEQKKELGITRSLESAEEPKYRLLPGFRTPLQQEAAIDAVIYDMMQLANEAAKKSNIQLLEAFSNEKINNYIGSLLDKYKTDVKRIEELGTTADAKDQFKLKTYNHMGLGTAADGVWEDSKDANGLPIIGFKTQALRGLTKYGFRVMIKGEVRTIDSEDIAAAEELEDNNDGPAEAQKEKIHNLNHFLLNPVDGLSTRLKLFLSSIPNIEGKVTMFGTPKPIPFNQVWATLSTKLADSDTPSAKLAELAEVDPTMKAVSDRLAEELNSGNQRLFNEFNTKFNLSYHDFMSVRAGFDGMASKAQFIEANRTTIDRTLRDIWRENAVRKKVIDLDGKQTPETIKKVAAVKRELEEYLSDLSTKKLSEVSFPEMVKKTKHLLSELGIYVPEEVFADIENLKNRETIPGKDSVRHIATLKRIIGDIEKPSIRQFVDDLLANKDAYNNKNSGVHKELSNRARNYMPDLHGGTFLDEFSNPVFPYNLPSYLSEFFRKVKQSPQEIIDFFKQDKAYDSNSFLNTIKAKAEELRMVYISASKQGKQDARSFEERNTVDSLLTRLVGFYNNAPDSKMGYFSIGTFADKSKQVFLSLPKRESSTQSKGFLIKVLEEASNFELVRINRIRQWEGQKRRNQPLPSDIKGKNRYSEQTMFKYVPGLNTIPGVTDSLMNGEISDFSKLIGREESTKVFNAFIEQEYSKFLKKLVENGIIDVTETGGKRVITNLLIPTEIMKSGTIDQVLENFFYQDTAYRLSMSQVFMGDIAQYNGDEDYFKRSYQLVTPGIKPSQDPEHPSKLTRIVYQGLEFKNEAPYLASIAQLMDPKVTEEAVQKAMVEGKSDNPVIQRVLAYSKVNKTDAQSLMTIKSWRTLAIQLGVWSKDHEDVYEFAWKHGLTVRRAVSDALKKGDITEDRAKELRKKGFTVMTSVLKPFQFRDNVVTLPNDEKWIIKEQFKDSICPLIPELTQVHKGYADLKQFMALNKVSIASAHDTVKVGLYGVVDSIYEEKVEGDKTIKTPKLIEQWQKREFPVTELRLPQLVSDEVKDETAGSQFHKLIMGNVDPGHTYLVDGKEVTGEKLIAMYNDAWVEKLQASAKNLREKLGLKDNYILSENPVERKEQLLKIKARITEELLSRNFNENYHDAIELVARDGEMLDFVVPLAFPTMSKKFTKIFTSMFKKAIIKQKMTGTSVVNLADFTVEKDEALKYVQNVDGHIESAEIGLSIDYFKNIGLDYIVHTQNGRIRWDKLNEQQKKALEMILYRIPTSNKSSMTLVKVALLLPPNSNVVMIPGELTTQQGLDFDVDKSQLIRRALTDEEVEVEGKKTKNAKIDKEHPDTKLFEVYQSILSNPRHVGEMINPLTTRRLEEKLADFKAKGVVSAGVGGAAFFTATADMAAEILNKDAKMMIGISSRYNTGHSVIQMIKSHVHINSELLFELSGKPEFRFNELGRNEDASGTLISENHGEVQQAHLDAAKTPLMGYMNVSKYTNGVLHTMLNLGVPLDVAMDFFSQPIIKEYTRIQAVSNITFLEGVSSELYSLYPEVKQEIDGFKTDLTRIKTKALSAGLVPAGQEYTAIKKNPEHSARVLREFFRMMKLAQSMTNINNVLSIDTLSDMSGSEKIENLIVSKNKSLDPEAPVFLDPSLFDINSKEPNVRRVAAFYKLAIDDAQEMLGQFFPYLNSSYTAVKSYYNNTIAKVDQAMLGRLDTWLDYYVAVGMSNMMQGLLNQYPQGLAKPSTRWSFYEQSGNSILDYINTVTGAYPELKNNALLSNIKRSSRGKDGLQAIGVNNTNSYAMKNEMINAWFSLLNSAHPDAKTRQAYRLLGLDLVYYAIRTSGFNYTTSSFVDLVPTQFWIDSGIAENYRNTMKALTSSNEDRESTLNIDVDGAIVGFIRQNYTLLDKLPTLYTKWTEATEKRAAQPKLGKGVIKNSIIIDPADENHITGFTLVEGKNTPRFIKMQDNANEVIRLYESHPEYNREYREVQGSGEPKKLYQVSAGGRHQSMNPVHAGVSPNPWGTVDKISKTYPLLSNAEPGTNKFLKKYIPGATIDPSTLLQNLIAAETEPYQRKILETLLNNVSKINTNIELSVLQGKFGELEVKRVPGGFDSVIRINPDLRVKSDQEMRHILAHELEHAFTVGVLQKPEGEFQVNFERNIERIRQEARTRFGAIQGTENKYEFIAELASNHEFRNKLKGTDLWNRILRFFRKLFNVKDVYDKILDQRYAVISQTENLNAMEESVYALEEEKKEKVKGSKKIDLMQQMLSSLEARATRLRGQGKETGAKLVKANIDTLKELMKTDRAQAITRYLIITGDEIERLQKGMEVFKTNPEKINSRAIVATYEQLASYSLLDSFSDQIRKNPTEYVPSEEAVPVFLNKLTEVRNIVRDLNEQIKDISLTHYATVVLEASKDPNLTLEKVKEELEVASRDIGWGYHVMTSIGVDSRDLIVKTNHKMIKDAYAGADRATFADLYSKEPKKTKVTFRFYKKLKNKKGEEYTTSMAKEFNIERVGIFQATEEYEKWLTSNGKNKDSLRDKFSPIIDSNSLKEDSDGIKFIDPVSKEGQKILSIPKDSADFPLRQFYETIVLGYLKAQENIPKHMRPGLRVPSIQRSMLEGVLRGEWKVFKEKSIDLVRRRYDEADRKAVDENGKPISGIPIRYIAKQDGQGGKLTPSEVSLDFPTTVAMAINEFHLRNELTLVQPEVEMGKLIAESRKVLKADKRTGGLAGLLTSERETNVLASGQLETIDGVESNAYKKVEADMRRLMYGIMKKDEGEFTVKGKKFDWAKVFDTVMKFTGMKIMIGNIAIPLTNTVVGEVTMLKEVVGGNMINASDYKAGWKFYYDTALAAVSDLGNREKKTKAGKMIQFFNPIDSERPINSIGVDSTYMRTIVDKLMDGTNASEFLLAMQATGAVFNRFKAKDSSGKDVSIYDAVDIDKNGKIHILPGFTYKGKTTITPRDIDEIRDYVLRTYESMHGVYNRLDSPVAKETIVGRLVMFMRNWLPEGINNRWRTRFFDERLNQQNEGYYTSAMIMFNNMFSDKGFLKNAVDNLRVLFFMSATNPKLLLHPNELELTEEQQAEIINLRQANMRKTLFELYLITGLSLLLAFGWDEDDDDSYAKYMAARVQRELLTFINPTTAWDVLRSPTVALNTVDGFRKVIWDIGDAGVAVATGEELPVYEQGPKKGEYKLSADIKSQFGLAWMNQFEGLDTKTRLIQRGWN